MINYGEPSQQKPETELPACFVLLKWMFHKLICVEQSTFLRYLWVFLHWPSLLAKNRPGNTKGGSITLPLTSSLNGLY